MSSRRLPRKLASAAILAAFGVLPPLVLWLAAPAPQERHIHVTAFRYGAEPSVIRVNRSDRLRLTFSTRDTGHSFLLQEYDLDAKISPGSDEVEVFRPSRPEDPPQRMREVTLVAGQPGPFGWLVSKSRFRCHVYCGPLHGLEHGDLTVQPNLLLAASLGLVIAIPLVILLSFPNTQNREPRTGVAAVDLFRLLPHLKRLLKRRGLQFATQVPTLAILYLLILAGLFGTKVPGRNLAIMLPWIVWLFLLAAVLVPLGGRLWCLMCPLPVFGEWLQRRAITHVRPGQTGPYRNQFFGLFRPWPRGLSNAWPRTIAFLIVGTLGTLLVCVPKATAGALIILTLLPLGMALVWELRAFCRYVCPINAFVGLYAMAGRLAVRPTKIETCRQCQIRSCQLGNHRGWPCPYGLCVGEMERNNDCGLCTECVKSCAYDNVSLYWRPFGSDLGKGRASRGRLDSNAAGDGGGSARGAQSPSTVSAVAAAQPGVTAQPGAAVLHAQETRPRNQVSPAMLSRSEAWQAIVLLVMAFAYAVTHLGPWPAVRNWVDIVDKGNWAGFAAYGGALWAVALLGAPLVVYAVVWACGRVGGWASGNGSVSAMFVASAAALVPMGLFAWIAVMVPMVMVNATFVLCTLSDPFGLNWNLFGTAGLPWWQIWPAAIPWIQAGCILAGLWYSLRAAERAQKPLTGLLMLIAALLLWLFVG